MSYILDALKKVERERAFEQLPDIAAVHEAVTAPRPARWPWALLAALIVIAAVATAVWTLRYSNGTPTEAEGLTTIPTPPTAVDSPSTPTPPNPGPTVGRPTGEAVNAAAVIPGPPADRPLRPLPLPSLPVPTPAEAREPTGPLIPALPPFEDDALRPATPTEPGTVATPVTGSGQAAAPIAGPRPAPVEAATAPGPEVRQLPVWPLIDRTLSQHVDGGLVLNGHVYTPEPEGRFVLLNMRKYTEGDRIAEGPRLEQITREGVILAVPDGRFRVTAD
jgi:general secretion pathway protein B